MDKKEFLNSKYLKLCQQLGDAIVKLDQLNEHISNLKSQIDTLNQSFNIMSEHDAISRASKASEELKNGQK